MRKTIFIVLGILLPLFIHSQTLDVVYLKNGSVIKGSITEFVPSDHVKITTSDGSIFVYNSSEIEKITKETTSSSKPTVDINKYGGKFSYGIALGGGGIIGVPIRAYLSPKFALELGAFYRPAIVVNSESGTTLNSILIAGGMNYYFSKYYKEKKEKVKMNGITVKSGIGSGDFSTFMVGGGWIHESFKQSNTNRSFTFELGPGLLISDNYPAGYYDYNTTSFALYWKLTWNWYSK
jgi:hypothetical protein